MTLRGYETFGQKLNCGFQIRTPENKLSHLLETNSPIFWGMIWKPPVFVQTFHGPSVSQNEAPVKHFGSGNLLFRQNKPIKFENWTLLAKEMLKM